MPHFKGGCGHLLTIDQDAELLDRRLVTDPNTPYCADCRQVYYCQKRLEQATESVTDARSAARNAAAQLRRARSKVPNELLDTHAAAEEHYRECATDLLQAQEAAQFAEQVSAAWVEQAAALTRAALADPMAARVILATPTPPAASEATGNSSSGNSSSEACSVNSEEWLEHVAQIERDEATGVLHGRASWSWDHRKRTIPSFNPGGKALPKPHASSSENNVAEATRNMVSDSETVSSDPSSQEDSPPAVRPNLAIKTLPGLTVSETVQSLEASGTSLEGFPSYLRRPQINYKKYYAIRDAAHRVLNDTVAMNEHLDMASGHVQQSSKRKRRSRAAVEDLGGVETEVSGSSEGEGNDGRDEKGTGNEGSPESGESSEPAEDGDESEYLE